MRVRVHAPSSETQGRDDAIYSGESLLQEQTSPWAHILTEPVPEVFEFRPADCPEKYISSQSVGRKSNTSETGSVRKSAQGLFSLRRRR